MNDSKEKAMGKTAKTADDVVLAAGDAAWLRVLLDNAVPRESGGPLDWEGDGRRGAERLLRDGSSDG